ncbi:MAG: hypothetical protein ACR2JH_10775 [Solirubrobacteraceae bacterium]
MSAVAIATGSSPISPIPDRLPHEQKLGDLLALIDQRHESAGG